MDYSYIMINILMSEFDFKIANLYYKKILWQSVIPNKSVTAITTTKKVYGKNKLQLSLWALHKEVCKVQLWINIEKDQTHKFLYFFGSQQVCFLHIN